MHLLSPPVYTTFESVCSLTEKESECCHQMHEYSNGVFSFLHILRDEEYCISRHDCTFIRQVMSGLFLGFNSLCWILGGRLDLNPCSVRTSYLGGTAECM